MLGEKTSNRGRNPLVWLAPYCVCICKEGVTLTHLEHGVVEEDVGRRLGRLVPVSGQRVEERRPRQFHDVLQVALARCRPLGSPAAYCLTLVAASKGTTNYFTVIAGLISSPQYRVVHQVVDIC